MLMPIGLRNMRGGVWVDIFHNRNLSCDMILTVTDVFAGYNIIFKYKLFDDRHKDQELVLLYALHVCFMHHVLFLFAFFNATHCCTSNHPLVQK